MVKFRMVKLLFVAIIALMVSGTLDAAEVLYSQILSSNFHTLRVVVDSDDQLPPVMLMDAGHSLTVSFDELASDRRYMRYQLLHCNADWTKSQLVESEYLDGFNEGVVDDYRFSQATTVQYVHYSITLPNEQMRITASGNYLLRVYDEQNPDDTLLQVRFGVAEGTMRLDGSITSRTDTDYNGSHQQLALRLDCHSVPVGDVYSDVVLGIQQNGRVDNQLLLKRPTRMQGGTAWWEHDARLIYPAGNEYRRMESVSTTYPGMHVQWVEWMEPMYHVQLYTDMPRSDASYVYDRTQHGRFRIREYNSDDPDVEADYQLVHFTLDMPEQVGYDVFLDGDFTQRRFSPESRMIYNANNRLYEHTVLLKQGAYNYQYLAVPTNGSLRGETSIVEGDYYPTVNEYIVQAYYRKPGSRHDRLTAFTIIK